MAAAANVTATTATVQDRVTNDELALVAAAGPDALESSKEATSLEQLASRLSKVVDQVSALKKKLKEEGKTATVSHYMRESPPRPTPFPSVPYTTPPPSSPGFRARLHGRRHQRRGGHPYRADDPRV